VEGWWGWGGRGELVRISKILAETNVTVHWFLFPRPILQGIPTLMLAVKSSGKSTSVQNEEVCLPVFSHVRLFLLALLATFSICLLDALLSARCKLVCLPVRTPTVMTAALRMSVCCLCVYLYTITCLIPRPTLACLSASIFLPSTICLPSRNLTDALKSAGLYIKICLLSLTLCLSSFCLLPGPDV
jgi:hypothetical protein